MATLSQQIVKASPLVHSFSISLVGVIVVLGLCLLPESTVEWKVVSTSLLLYGTASAIFSIFKKKWGRYILLSILGYLWLFGIMVLFTNYISNTPIKEIESIQMTIAALSVFYFMLLGLAGIYRFFIGFLKDVDKVP